MPRVGDALARYILKPDAPTTVASKIDIDYAKSTLTIDGKSFPFPPLSPAAQELIVAGGAENRLVAAASIATAKQKVTRTKFFRKNPASWFLLFPSVFHIRVIRVIRLVNTFEVDKSRSASLNTKLRGCPVTELATMSWKRRASCWIE